MNTTYTFVVIYRIISIEKWPCLICECSNIKDTVYCTMCGTSQGNYIFRLSSICQYDAFNAL